MLQELTFFYKTSIKFQISHFNVQLYNKFRKIKTKLVCRDERIRKSRVKKLVKLGQVCFCCCWRIYNIRQELVFKIFTSYKSKNCINLYKVSNNLIGFNNIDSKYYFKLRFKLDLSINPILIIKYCKSRLRNDSLINNFFKKIH
jgi:hypothetical protein